MLGGTLTGAAPFGGSLFNAGGAAQNGMNNGVNGIIQSGASGSITVSGSSFSVNGTVASVLGALSSGFTSSPFAADSIVTGNLTVTSSTTSVSGNITSSGGTISMTSFTVPNSSIRIWGNTGVTVNLVNAGTGNVSVGQMILNSGSTFNLNTTSAFSFGGATSNGATGTMLSLSALQGITASGDIILPEGGISLTASNASSSNPATGGAIVVQDIDTSGYGASPPPCCQASGLNGGSAGSISINADAGITTGYIRAYGGGGSGAGGDLGPSDERDANGNAIQIPMAS